MRAVLFAIWLLAMIQISWWTWSAPTHALPSAGNQAQDTFVPNDDLDAFKAYEEVRQAEETRKFFRSQTLETLTRAWSSFCEPDGHKRLLAEVGGYYDEIDKAVGVARQYHGAKVAAYVRERNNTTDDVRIDELVQQTYRFGYFSIDELPEHQRKLVSAVVKDEKPRGKPCN